MELSSHLGCLHLVARAAAPACEVGQDFTLLTIDTWLHLTPPLLSYYRCVHTGGCSSRRSSHLSGEAGTLDRLRSLLNLISVTAAMGCNHLTCASFHVHDVTAVRRRFRQMTPKQHKGQKYQYDPRKRPLQRPLLHPVGAVVRIIAQQQKEVSLPFHYDLFHPRTGDASTIRTKGSLLCLLCQSKLESPKYRKEVQSSYH